MLCQGGVKAARCLLAAAVLYCAVVGAAANDRVTRVDYRAEAIPRVVHFVRSDTGYALTFFDFVAMAAAAHNSRVVGLGRPMTGSTCTGAPLDVEPLAGTSCGVRLMLHAPGPPSGVWYERAVAVLGLQFVPMQPILEARPGVAVQSGAAQSDFMRVVVLRRYGGVYLDFDVVALRSLDELFSGGGATDSRQWTFVAGKQAATGEVYRESEGVNASDSFWTPEAAATKHFQHVCNAVMLASPESPTLVALERLARATYRPECYDCHSVRALTALSVLDAHALGVAGTVIDGGRWPPTAVPRRSTALNRHAAEFRASLRNASWTADLRSTAAQRAQSLGGADAMPRSLLKAAQAHMLVLPRAAFHPTSWSPAAARELTQSHSGVLAASLTAHLFGGTAEFRAGVTPESLCATDGELFDELRRVLDASGVMSCGATPSWASNVDGASLPAAAVHAPAAHIEVVYPAADSDAVVGGDGALPVTVALTGRAGSDAAAPGSMCELCLREAGNPVNATDCVDVGDCAERTRPQSSALFTIEMDALAGFAPRADGVREVVHCLDVVLRQRQLPAHREALPALPVLAVTKHCQRFTARSRVATMALRVQFRGRLHSIQVPVSGRASDMAIVACSILLGGAPPHACEVELERAILLKQRPSFDGAIKLPGVVIIGDDGHARDAAVPTVVAAGDSAGAVTRAQTQSDSLLLAQLRSLGVDVASIAESAIAEERWRHLAMPSGHGAKVTTFAVDVAIARSPADVAALPLRVTELGDVVSLFLFIDATERRDAGGSLLLDTVSPGSPLASACSGRCHVAPMMQLREQQRQRQQESEQRIWQLVVDILDDLGASPSALIVIGQANELPRASLVASLAADPPPQPVHLSLATFVGTFLQTCASSVYTTSEWSPIAVGLTELRERERFRAANTAIDDAGWRMVGFPLGAAVAQPSDVACRPTASLVDLPATADEWDPQLRADRSAQVRRGNYHLRRGYVARALTHRDGGGGGVNRERRRAVFDQALDFARANGISRTLAVVCGDGGEPPVGITTISCFDVEAAMSTPDEHGTLDRWLATSGDSGAGVGLVVVVDAFERLRDPDVVLRFLECLQPQYALLGTPDRLHRPRDSWPGPPSSETDVREWSAAEFRALCEEYVDVTAHALMRQWPGYQVLVGTPLPGSCRRDWRQL